MNEGAEEPDWVKHDRELESETEEALADLDAVVSGERPDAIPEAVWRVGRKVGRTIYVQLGPEPSDNDELIGVMDEPKLAQTAVEAVNAYVLRAAHPEAGNEEAEAESWRVVASMPVDAYEVLKPLIHKLGGEVQSAVRAAHPEADRAPEDER